MDDFQPFHHRQSIRCITRRHRVLRRISLSVLHPVSRDYSNVKTHVVFVHGLSGDMRKTWTTKQSTGEVLWPEWLAEDILGVGLWLVGYEAPKTNWRGNGLHLSDRADNVLARLLSEPRLANGQIVFVAHSLGGLVVKQILRNAQREADANGEAGEFLTRVSKVAFLGTPHKGSFFANIASFLPFLRPSESTRDLSQGNPQLRDLDHWYRKYSQTNGIEHLILSEGLAKKILGIPLPGFLGKVVSPDSADAGLYCLPIPVDEDHIGISKPTNREAEIYIHVRDFISRPAGAPTRQTLAVEAMERCVGEIQTLVDQTQKHTSLASELNRTLASSIHSRPNPAIFDEVVNKRLERLKKVRSFNIVNVVEEARSLVSALQVGDFSNASDGVKSTALAWCVRFLSANHPDEAECILSSIATPNAELIAISRSFIARARGNLPQALSELHAFNTPLARGAAYLNMFLAEGFEKAAQWFLSAGLTLSDIDSHAKFIYLKSALDEAQWSLAYQAAKELADDDFDDAPGLILAAADAYLMQTVPDELRMFVMQYVPFDPANFPLRSEPAALEDRRAAAGLYERLCTVAEPLDMPGIVEYAGDKALWLRLMDTETATDARKDLIESIKNVATLLRRLNVALNFGVKVDLEMAEREVDRQTALSGGTSREAAAARFALATTKTSRASAAAYIDQHREQLLKHIDWKDIYVFEIEMLATSGQTAQATERIEEAVEKGLSELETNRIRSLILASTRSDPTDELLSIYVRSKALPDLRNLVRAYQDRNNWQKVAEYSKRLLELTGDIGDAHRYVVSLYNIGRHSDVLAVLEKYSTLPVQYDQLYLLHTQTLYEIGRLKEALLALHALREMKDSPEARQLQISLSVASGDWESLQSFVETEWGNRGNRTPFELLNVGRIAWLVGASRTKYLVREAASRAPDDPVILSKCFFAATQAGWENSAEARQWMKRSVELSSEEGPVQMVSIEDFFEKNSGWDKHESNVWEQLMQGTVPMFTVSRVLNRSLFNLFLLPALSNLDESDVRKRPMIYAFSGARGSLQLPDPRFVGMDVTTLMTLEFLGLLNICIGTFDTIVVPHSTLGWILEEKAGILFHQPSRVSTARDLRQMISEGHLRAFEGSTVAPESLVKELGETLASLISEASFAEHPDSRQRLVVSSCPVYKANSFMREKADLNEYENFLCSCLDVVEKLYQKAVLTTHEADEARATLAVLEKPCPSRCQISDGAILYLDDVTVSHRRSLGL
jgi:pimeloyl-ACP methyl ester carboxylesterase